MNVHELHLETNRKAWNERAELHVGSKFYDVPGFKAGRCSLNAIERDALGDVADKTVLHLQCHFGQDTLSLARLGAKATGVDFSPEAIKIARQLRSDLKLEADFVCEDVLKLELNKVFDIVYTSYGVLTWLDDLNRWADRVDAHLAPGGVFHLVEFHPTLMMFDFDSKEWAYHYFRHHYQEEVAGSYAAQDDERVHSEHFWSHSLEEVLTPLLERGFQLLEFEEYDHSPYGCFSNMNEEEPGVWRWDSKIRFPHLFRLKMTR